MNFYALNNLNFSDLTLGQIDLANTSANIKMKASNPTLFPASFQKMSLKIDYRETSFGTLVVTGATISPFSQKNLDGTLKINVQSLAGLVFASMFGGDSGFDRNDLRFVAKLDAPIFGIIPYSITKQYSADEFQSLLNEIAKRGAKESSDLINPFK